MVHRFHDLMFLFLNDSLVQLLSGSMFFDPFVTGFLVHDSMRGVVEPESNLQELCNHYHCQLYTA